MFTSEHHVGRLIELRIRSPITVDELQELRASQIRHVLSIDEKFISVTDLRRAFVFPPAIADGFLSLMKQANPRLDRSAFLVSDSATFSLQAERILTELGNPDRRAFREADDLELWLSQVLTDAERRRLRRFLVNEAL